MSRLLGIDPGLHITGWGVIDFDCYHLKHVAHGSVVTPVTDSISVRLSNIYKGISDVIEQYSPNEVSIEQVFVNMYPTSSLKLGMARGAAVCCVGVCGLPLFEYTPNEIKKTVVGVGHAAKEQVSVMVQKLLNCGNVKADMADALAIAVCHAHHKTFYKVAS